METGEILGWLFDIYHHEDEITLWILDEKQRIHYLKDVFYPVIYIAGNPRDEARFISRLAQLNALNSEPVREVKKEIYSQSDREVWRIEISRPSILKKIARKLYAFTDRLDIYHSDIDLPVFYMYSKGIFPLARVRVQTNPFNRVKNISTEIPGDTPFRETQYELPKFRMLTMKLRHAHRNGLSAQNPLELTFAKEKVTLSPENPSRFLIELNKILTEVNPDVLLSSYGDQFLFPSLFTLAARERSPLLLDRDDIYLYRNTGLRGTSYESYGNMIFRAAPYPTYGRWHIDTHNSFAYRETQLSGLLELARVTRLPVQRMSRSSTGQALTAMQVWTALSMGYLVPWQKSKLERPKTARKLLDVDKGGLVYLPDNRRGKIHENVLELDYSQMYPSMMVLHNISPETVLCDCCDNSKEAERVPGNGDHICEKRRGIVPETLQGILERRRIFKQIKQSGTPEEKVVADARQSSLKWMLVTSFGYLGYRNAKFGRLESHEAVTAYGRDALLIAKEIAEEHNYSLIHAMTDCIFIKKENPEEKISVTDPENLSRKMEEVTGVEMSYEGQFSWIVFLNSNGDPELSTATRFFGRYTDGSMKYRGVLLRRKDTPLYFRAFQKKIIDLFSQGNTPGEVISLLPRAENLYDDFRLRLEKNRVDPQDLLYRLTIGKELSDYSVSSPTHLIMRQLPEHHISPGEKVRYLIVDRKNKNPFERYLAEEILIKKQKNGKTILPDKSVYIDVLDRAYRELVEPFTTEYFWQRHYVRTSRQQLLFEDSGKEIL